MLVAKTAARERTGADGAPAGFIVGVTRSGTTLLRMMLDAHPQLAIPPETHFIPEVATACRSAGDAARSFVATVVAHPRWPDFRISGDSLRRAICGLESFDLGRALRTFYQLYAGRFEKLRWSDKTPAYVDHMGLIQMVLAEARFIHLIRDGRDAALSVKDLSFGPNSIAEAAHLWVERITGAREQLEGIAHYLEVRYEDLVLDTEATLRKICSFLELAWHPAMLVYHARSAERLAEMNRDLPDHTGRTLVTGQERVGCHRLVTAPPQASRVGRWRTEMSDADRRCYESIAGPLLWALGYEV